MNGLTLSHYTERGTLVPEAREQPQPPYGPYTKPHGLWLSVDGERDWPTYCREAGHELENRRRRFEVRLASDANVLWLKDAWDLDDFTDEFGRYMVPRHPAPSIRWHAVADVYAGLIVAPYVWERRLEDHTSWYYGWDCASGCIWDPSAIETVRLDVNYGLERTA